MMKILAIPERLNKPADKLTPEEKEELKQFGPQPLTTVEIQQAAIDAERNLAARAEAEAVQYKKERASELRKLDGDGLDAIRKAIAAIAEATGVKLPDEFAEYFAKVETIKSENPKPTEK